MRVCHDTLYCLDTQDPFSRRWGRGWVGEGCALSVIVVVIIIIVVVASITIIAKVIVVVQRQHRWRWCGRGLCGLVGYGWGCCVGGGDV